MKLLLLHGPPAAGKRTIAEQVVGLAGGRLFDNHVAVDFARSLFEFDAPGFWTLVHRARLTALETAAEQGIPLVVTTCCYSHPEDLPLLEDFEGILARHGGTLLPVYLECDRDTLMERVSSPDRVKRGKVATLDGLEGCLARWNLVPVPRPGCLTVDTARLQPREAARRIIDHFGLTR